METKENPLKKADFLNFSYDEMDFTPDKKNVVEGWPACLVLAASLSICWCVGESWDCSWTNWATCFTSKRTRLSETNSFIKLKLWKDFTCSVLRELYRISAFFPLRFRKRRYRSFQYSRKFIIGQSMTLWLLGKIGDINHTREKS